jgi:sialic acid synthase SpsE
LSEIILDISANTFKNSFNYAKQMMDEIKTIDTGKHHVIFKTQLFKSAPPNIPLEHSVFDSMYHYGKSLGYQVTSSVFDKESLDFLLQYDVPMIKIANNRKLDYLIGEIPRKIPVYVSFDGIYPDCFLKYENIKYLACISKYPATIEDYELMCGKIINKNQLKNISDHTIGLELFKKYQPKIWECHYALEDSTGLDAGLFAKRPNELKEIL